MKIAFMITAYVDEKHLARLIDALGDDDTFFFIHIDKKVDIQPFINELRKCDFYSHVNIIKKRFLVNWGGYSQVEAQREIIKNILTSDKNFDWCVSITGTDYPVWSNKKIKEQLANRNTPIIGGYDMSKLEGYFFNEQRIHKYWVFDLQPVWLGRIVRNIIALLMDVFHVRINKKYDEKYIFAFGSEYWAIPIPMLRKVYDYYFADKTLQRILKHAFVPSEHWIHTCLLSGGFVRKEDVCIVGDTYQELDAVSPLSYFFYKGQIKVLTEKDYDVILNSNKMFARKVLTGKSDKLAAMIDELRNKEE